MDDDGDFMRWYKPQTPFNVAAKLLIPTTSVVSGARKTEYPEPDDGIPIFVNFRTFGGTENFQNNVYTVFATGTVETWFRSDITSECRLYIVQSKETYDIISEPENIGMRNQFVQFKVQKIGGKP